ncbi:tRNA (adenosine(37)-N6)-threonylcarbamoyltransferase complex ATPase subunit type 1 TsaE [Algibacter sp. 2305UL17-15]|uniref:tRNA (adenosine(37)-N6)-threonylcarbamoyltransferase complex ATPase subunit type 1 TsaE n=1 Tax=Algibacter sp. 2305UL17-15 TaxID=3231268 RepID=UPI0034591976
MEITYALNEVDDVAKQLVNQLSSKIILLYGAMGVGKTTLVRSITKALGGNENEVSSPTYSIVNEYEIDNNLLYHFDLYRLNNLEEAYNFGIEEYLYSDHWIIVEWPELIKPILPDHFTELFLQEKSNKKRCITLKK